MRKEAKPHNVLLVLDAMTGQEAVNVAEAFQERIDFDGVVLTKLDGDARGGAALSVKAVTGKPIKLASVGEKLDQLEWFHPDRMASRILGMGDVLTLIEKAEEAVEEDEQAAMEERMRARPVHLRRLPRRRRRCSSRMGPLQGVLKMIPGLGNQLKDVDIDERQLERVEAIVLSMTPQERRMPHLINGSRRQRIARGLGHDRPAGEPAADRAQADGEDDEADGQGQDAVLAGTHQGRTEVRRVAVKLRLTRVGSKKNPIYRVVAADSRSRATASSSRSSAATTRRPSRRRSSSTRTRSRTGSRRARSRPSRSRGC